MSYMESDISMETKLGDGSTPNDNIFKKLFTASKRVAMGESLFMTHFTNRGQERRSVAFSAPFPGTIAAINLGNTTGSVICQREAFLSAALGTKLSIEFTKRMGAGFFGKEGFVLQRLEGDGMAFLHAGGTLVEKHLENEKIRIDSGSLVGFTSGMDYSVDLIKSVKSMLFSGEGAFLTTISGTGTVWIQSLPFPRLVDRIHQSLPVKKKTD
jgi:uncharacterized protein (TIGR00266 family)